MLRQDEAIKMVTGRKWDRKLITRLSKASHRDRTTLKANVIILETELEKW